MATGLAIGAFAAATAALLRKSDEAFYRVGFGAGAVGGTGGRIVTVTSLDDEGPGTLREALERTTGARIVRFALAGTIRLKREIRVVHPDLTLDGTTAPGDGVTVSGARLRIETRNVIITGMQLRPGDDRMGDEPSNRDALSLGDGASDVLVVGNSLTWALDENVSLWGAVRNVTLAYNIIGEALRDSIHIDENSKGTAPHSMGMIIGSGEGDQLPERVTVARNLFISNDFRNPYLQTGRMVEIVCNLVVNYGAGHQAISVGDGRSVCTAVIAGNVFWPGHDTRSDRRPPLDLTGLPADSALFLGANALKACEAEGCEAVSTTAHGRLDRLRDQPDFVPTSAGDLALADVPDRILRGAGTRNPQNALRPIDNQLIRAAREMRSRIIDRTTDSVGLG